MQTRAYLVVTAAYWAFTVTDGALRMLVLLYFHELGYNPVSLAFLFLLYEAFGVVTNLVGGWVGARQGLHRTLVAGLGLQVVALVALSMHSSSWSEWIAVAWVMAAQALSGIAKDLTKMSSKSALKSVVSSGALFRLVAVLTGSKNALKGVGFFVGAALLGWQGFDRALWIMAVALVAVLLAVFVLLPSLPKPKAKPTLRSALTKSPSITRLSTARLFLFGSRDVWFVVALPIFLGDELGWSFEGIGAFLAFWVIGYGIVQSFTPSLLARFAEIHRGASAFLFPMMMTAAVIAFAVANHALQALITVVGLLLFGVLFALTSAVHSYLILAYSKSDEDVAMDVGFYYSANAAGRLLGTLLSGVLYLVGGFPAALCGTIVLLAVALFLSSGLPSVHAVAPVPPGNAHH